MKALTRTVNDEGIATISIDVPDETMNVLNQLLADEFAELWAELEKDASVRGIIITSGKSNSFVAGADIKMLNDVKTAEDGKRISAEGQALFSRMQDSPRPVVAAIHGPCLGGGLELALACHYRIASDDPKTKIGLPEVMLGLLPGGRGATPCRPPWICCSPENSSTPAGHSKPASSMKPSRPAFFRTSLTKPSAG